MLVLALGISDACLFVGKRASRLIENPTPSHACLRRAGWRVIRIPYRKWLRNREAELAKILAALDEEGRERLSDVPEPVVDAPPVPTSGGDPTGKPRAVRAVTRNQEAIIRALREGITDEERLWSIASVTFLVFIA